MRSEVLDLLRCPECGGPLRGEAFSENAGDIESGVAWCTACGSWFPVEDGILELLREGLSYAEDRARFWAAHHSRLRSHNLTAEGPRRAADHDASVREQQQHFDWYAHNEEQTYTTYEAMPFWRAADALAFGPWRKKIESGRRLLDVACAQGRSTFPWMDLDIEIVAFDVSRDLVRQAAARYRAARPRARATFLVANAVDFPFVSGAFDYVLAYGVLHHMPDPAHVCQEIGRVLRPGGTFFGSENNRTVFRQIFEILQARRPLWHEEAGSHALISQSDLRRWLEPHGFRTSFRTSIFAPPHAVNRFGASGALALLRSTDGLARAIPFLRGQGGLILVEALKDPVGPPAAAARPAADADDGRPGERTA